MVKSILISYLRKTLILIVIAFCGRKAWKSFKRIRRIRDWWHNDFEKICKRLNKKWYNISGIEKYAETKKAVRDYVQGDWERLMQLKSEAEAGSYSEFVSTTLSLFAAGISIISMLYSFLGGSEMTITKVNDSEMIWGTISSTSSIDALIIIIIVYVLFIITMVALRSNSFVGRWRGYVLTAISEVEDEIRNNGNIEKLGE